MWGNKQDVAMAKLKEALMSAPALVKIDYLDGAREIIIGVNASRKK